MTGWVPWDRASAPEQLADYVLPDVVRRLLPAGLAQRLPGPGDGGTAQEKAQGVYEVLAAAGIRYVHEPTISPRGGQALRPPDQVLARTRQGTCIDLALVFAGACLDAGLWPMVVVVDSKSAAPAHAVVVLWLGGRWSLAGGEEGPFGEELFTSPPALDSGISVLEALRSGVDGSGAFVAVDVEALARHGETPPKPWDESVRRGYDVLTATSQPDGAWWWSLGADAGEARRARHGMELPEWPKPAFSVLSSPYTEPVNELSPLTQIKARSGRVPFLPREELHTLIDWSDPIAAAEGDSPSVAVVPKVGLGVITGVGGSGKTHLAAELCRRLAGQGWYAGFVSMKRERKEVGDKSPEAERGVTEEPSVDEADWLAGLDWLSGVVSPVLAVVDYADECSPEQLLRLLERLAMREYSTRVVFTARAEGQWLQDLDSALQRDNLGVRRDLALALARRHGNPGLVYLRTFQKFAPAGRSSGEGFSALATQTNWTTLDVVAQAWLAATTHVEHDQGAPKTRADLYDEILNREFRYWEDAIEGHLRNQWQVSRNRLAVVGATLTLVAPAPDEVRDVLGRLGEPEKGEPAWGLLGEVLGRLLDEPSGGLAVRPDPIGEHLLLRECRREPTLVDRILPRLPESPGESATRLRQQAFERNLQGVLRQWERATEVVSRAAQFDRQMAANLAEECLSVRPEMWPISLSHALRQGGVFASALEVLARRPDTPLPLDELTGIQSGHGALRGLALVATQATKPVMPERPGEADWAALAGWLNNLAARLSEVGDRVGALEAIREAVELRRGLAEQNPGAFLPDLAGSLNNLANRLSEVGDRVGALEAIREAVGLRRGLAEQNPGAFLPDLAGSLNNLANRLSEVGDRVGALEAIREAVELYRGLAEQNPGAFLPDLAGSLNNLANRLSEVGDRVGALEAIREAVGLYRGLAEQNPGAFLPDLAGSLNNLANRLSEVGDRVGALEAIREAVGLRRGLAEQNPGAFLPNLAGSLNNLANRLSEVGDRVGALEAIREAVGLYRGLAEQNPGAFLPDLAGSLNNLAALLSEVGDRVGALEAIREAVGLYRGLAEQNPGAFLPNLAGSLNNLANRLSEVGDRAGALEAIREAVGLYRGLAEQNPGAFLPDLAMSLNNLANRLSEVGDRAGALEAIREAVGLRRGLAEQNPGAFLPNLAASLNNLANRLSEVGDRTGALQAFEDAWSGLTSGTEIHLRLARVRWLLQQPGSRDDVGDPVVSDLAEASLLCEQVSDDPRAAGESRRSVVGTVAWVLEERPDLADEFVAKLPGWTLFQPGEDLMGLGNQWLRAGAWAAREQFLSDHLHQLTEPEVRAGLRLLCFQQPELGELALLERLLDDIERDGLPAVLAGVGPIFVLREQLEEWLQTTDWHSSERYLLRHPNLVGSRDALAVLASYGDSPMIRQHRGLLVLAAAAGVEAAYAARADAEIAADLGNELIEKLQWDAIPALLQSAPGLAKHLFNVAYLILVHSAIDHREDGDWQPDEDLLGMLREVGTPEQCQVAANRLRRLRKHHPDLPARLSSLADALVEDQPETD